MGVVHKPQTAAKTGRIWRRQFGAHIWIDPTDIKTLRLNGIFDWEAANSGIEKRLDA
jgi:hypothetical protein